MLSALLSVTAGDIAPGNAWAAAQTDDGMDVLDGTAVMAHSRAVELARRPAPSIYVG